MTEDLSGYFPLPFVCQHERYTDGDEDAHGNTEPDWLDPVDVQCVWWMPDTSELPVPNAGGVLTAANLLLAVDSALAVDPRDRFTIETRRFEVIGLPKDYDHGPFGFATNRLIIELRWVG